MILYHGSNMEIKNPQILTQDKGRDFGFGFYTTSIREQAERWAIRKARLSSRLSKEQKNAVVNIYEFDESILNHINYKNFQEPNLEWLDFVIKCRTDFMFKHNYDVVSGKIANDNVGETVEYVLAGIMRKEDAVDRLRFEKINNQICFCSEESLAHLIFKESYICNF
ncbi:MAG: DUF3990 domain-containing protein [Spirochaetota bacterium]|jgi:hypothetical protein|nr:DUF3990 domain-containing protein [Spirochaetota bacterium]